MSNKTYNWNTCTTGSVSQQREWKNTKHHPKRKYTFKIFSPNMTLLDVKLDTLTLKGSEVNDYQLI